MRSLLFCQVFPLALMSSSIFEFVGKKKGSKKKKKKQGGGGDAEEDVWTAEQ